MIDPSRFRYPERAIVFLAICYLVVGSAFVAGLGAGDTVSCREPFPPPIKLGRLQMMSTITQVCLHSLNLFMVCTRCLCWVSTRPVSRMHFRARVASTRLDVD